MKNLWKCVSGLCAVMALGPTAANAQTVMNGPYYATPSWNQTLPAATRFVVLSNFNNEAVLDRETGLVWERSPSNDPDKFSLAKRFCANKTLGNRKGWKLPTVQELLSLVDPSVAYQVVALPAGHPFTDVQLAEYWSATSIYDDDPGYAAYAVDFSRGGTAGSAYKTLEMHGRWCVRGGEAVDPQ